MSQQSTQRGLMAAYEAEKAKWKAQHPWATPEQFEQAMRRIAAEPQYAGSVRRFFSLPAKFAAIALAALLTVVTNGSVLLTFNNVAQEATLAQNRQAPIALTLDTVTVVGHQS